MRGTRSLELGCALLGLLLLSCGDAPLGGVSGKTPDAAHTARVSALLGSGLSTGGDGSALGVGAELAAGSLAQTDARTQARLTLPGGVVVVLDRDSQLRLPTAGGFSLLRGQALATSPDSWPTAPADNATPHGTLRSSPGARYTLAVQQGRSNLRVSRGNVEVAPEGGEPFIVEGGQEATFGDGEAPCVVAASDVTGTLTWSEQPAQPSGAEPLAGLGELRAHRPGEREAQERPLTLAAHHVEVNIAGNMARTEVTETFRNDGQHVLEGVYRFPLPAGAQIASLELEVDGRWERGAFVPRERARRIWRGVIRNATPKAKPRPREEFIWVPGPWRDPALLEWERGGRFQLRIYPIPARGVRRIRLAYTEQLPAAGNGYRYVYPLPMTDDQRVGRFSIDVKASARTAGRIQAQGYPLERHAAGDAVQLHFEAEGFAPSGDLWLQLEGAQTLSELRHWTYRGLGASEPRTSRGTPRRLKRALDALRRDARGHVAFALRPRLPLRTRYRPRDHVLVVDASHSMTGERAVRTATLVETLIANLDRRDRVTVLACAGRCTSLVGPHRPVSAQLATQSRTALASVRAAGSTDLLGAVREALRASEGGQRPRELLYLGDGAASVGYRRPGTVGAQIKGLLQKANARLSTVGVGSDADARMLAAMARSGGGHHTAYAPGQSVSTAAQHILQGLSGVSLQQPQVVLPEGLSAVAPAVLPNLRAGEELVISARMDRPSLEGELVLRGEVAGEAFEQRYPLNLSTSEATGNAFVPRLWAAQQVQALQDAAQPDLTRSVALSQVYGVVSPHTSLLVLESAAMFRAFGLDRSPPTVQWSGDGEVDTGESAGLLDVGADDPTGALADILAGGSETGNAEDVLAQTAGNRGARRSIRGRLKSSAPASGGSLGTLRARRPSLKRVRFTTEARVLADTAPTAAARKAAARARRALEETPDSRDRHRDLARALSHLGDLDDAETVLQAWTRRDRLDPEPLTYLADLVGRRGDRTAALRLLEGVVDLAPDEVRLHRRLAAAFDRLAMPERACAHRITLAELQPNGAAVVAAAVRCERDLGHHEGSELLLAGVSDARQRERVRSFSMEPVVLPSFRTELSVKAQFSGETDLDLSLITPQGTRVSCLGGRVTTTASDCVSSNREQLGLRRLTPGKYVLELSRTNDVRTPVTGAVQVRAMGQTRKLDFRLEQARVTLARIEVTRRRVTEVVPTPGPAQPVKRGRVQVSPAQHIAGSPFDDQLVMRTIRRRVRAIQVCYERELRRDATLSGTINLRFSILERGTVGKLTVASNGTGDPRVAQCVSRTIKRFRFNPGPEGGSADYALAVQLLPSG